MQEITGITKRRGAGLPHWTAEGAIYAVCFRLSDSIAQSKLRAWDLERKDIVKTAKAMHRNLSVAEQERLKELESENMERFLKNGYGACWLRNNAIATMVANAIRCFEDKRYRLFAWCIMPNHVHVVLQPFTDTSLADILHSWKSFTAKEANKILRRKGSFWREESYDHLIRNEHDLHRLIQYTWHNPDEAGMPIWQWRWKAEESSSHGLLAHT